MVGTKRTRSGSGGRAKNPKLDQSKETDVLDTDLHLMTPKGKSKESVKRGKGVRSGGKNTIRLNTRGAENCGLS